MAFPTQTVKKRILQLLRGGQTLTRQEIAGTLSLSMPTTLQHVTELIEAGILEECGVAQSNGGRKAKMLRLCPDAGFAVGVNVGVHHVEFVVIDLPGNLRQAGSTHLAFRDDPEWYTQFQGMLLDFLDAHQISLSQILGGGISFPGIIDGQEEQVIRSHILGLSHMRLDRFRKVLPFPAIFGNDANCACFAERSSNRDNYIYLSLNESVGGAIMLNGQIWTGDTFQAGEIGHIVLIPDGHPCYCGKRGCADAYLSPQALERYGWDDYLDHLAVLLTNLRMLFNIDLVVGGQVGAQMVPHMEDLRKKAAQYDHFARDTDYIVPCTQHEYACALGAASFALEKFSSRVLSEVEEESL